MEEPHDVAATNRSTQVTADPSEYGFCVMGGRIWAVSRFDAQGQPLTKPVEFAHGVSAMGFECYSLKIVIKWVLDMDEPSLLFYEDPRRKPGNHSYSTAWSAKSLP